MAVTKKEWHWKCKWFNHKYTKRLPWAGVTYGPYESCVRCGFNAEERA